MILLKKNKKLVSYFFELKQIFYEFSKVMSDFSISKCILTLEKNI